MGIEIVAQDRVIAGVVDALRSLSIGVQSWGTSVISRLRCAFGLGRWRAGKRIWPCRSSFNRSVRQAMSFGRPFSLRQSHLSHSSRESRLRFQDGLPASSSRIRAKKSARSRHAKQLLEFFTPAWGNPIFALLHNSNTPSRLRHSANGSRTGNTG